MRVRRGVEEERGARRPRFFATERERRGLSLPSQRRTAERGSSDVLQISRWTPRKLLGAIGVSGRSGDVGNSELATGRAAPSCCDERGCTLAWPLKPFNCVSERVAA